MQNKKISETVLIGGMLFSMLLWGLSWPSGKVLTRFCSPINFAGYRYIIVVATLLPTVYFLKQGFGLKKTGLLSVLISGILLALYSFSFFKGLKLGSAGAGGVLVTTLNPIMAYTIGIILNKKLPTKNESLGLMFGIIACILLLKIWDKPGALFESGNLYFLFAAFSWAVMSKFTSKGTKYGSSLGFSFWQYVITLLCLLPLMDFTEARAVAQISAPVFWFNLFFSSAIVTSGATTVFFYTTTRLGAEKASSFLFLVPFAAALSSWVFLGEQLQLNTAIGGLMGMVAVYFINKKQVAV